MFWNNSNENSIRLSGSYNFFVETFSKGILPFQSCDISFQVYNDQLRKNKLHFISQWYRIRNNNCLHLQGLKQQQSYKCSAQDLGSIIRVEIEADGNKAILEIGPIKLDTIQKSTLEGIIAAGGSKFPVSVMQENIQQQFKDNSSFLLTNDYIRIVSNDQDGSEKSVKFKYSIDKPILEVNSMEENIIIMLFNGDDEQNSSVKKFLNLDTKSSCFKLALKFNSRNAKDLILLAIRSFSAKNYLIDAKLINNINELVAEQNNEKSLFKIAGESQILLVEVENLKRELYQLVDQNKFLTQEKDNYQQEVKELEDQLQQTIESFTQIIEEFKSKGSIGDQSVLDMSIAQNKNDQNSRKIIRQIKEENVQLKIQIKNKNDEINVLSQMAVNKGNFFNESRVWGQQMEKMIDNDSSEKEEMQKKILELQNQLQNNGDSKIQELKKLNNLLLEDVKKFKSKIDQYQKEIRLLRENKNNDHQGVKQLEQLLQETRLQNEDLVRELDMMRSQVMNQKHKQNNEQKDFQIQILEKELVQIKSQNKELNQKLIEYQQLHSNQSQNTNYELKRLQDEQKQLQEYLQKESNEKEKLKQNIDLITKEKQSILEINKKNCQFMQNEKNQLIEINEKLQKDCMQMKERIREKILENQQLFQQIEQGNLNNNIVLDNQFKNEMVNSENLQLKAKNEQTMKQIETLKQQILYLEQSNQILKVEINQLKYNQQSNNDHNDVIQALTLKLDNYKLQIEQNEKHALQDNENQISELKHQISLLKSEIQQINQQNQIWNDNLTRTNQRLTNENTKLLNQLMQQANELEKYKMSCENSYYINTQQQHNESKEFINNSQINYHKNDQLKQSYAQSQKEFENILFKNDTYF